MVEAFLRWAGGRPAPGIWSAIFMFAGLRHRISGGTVRIALALAFVVGASFLFWASRDYAVIAPNWDGFVRGNS